ncbi:hypothetical protein E1180_11260 [Roseibium denhamense]|uniref:PilZ domain-containing protein n=1 Tax=Roseibium denhamense TaxID=76305 RepID=A0ABY1N6G9_9HYPH|nr:hypothetical protein [Roseibium denhamense]MTI06091.1 hypothetical protein [Roseibium denhamense]SMP01185.1 hypothetical protein SAMN06265374_0341 [Roseibium denhamense]
MAKPRTLLEARPAPASRTRLREGLLLDLKEAELTQCTLYDLDDGLVGIVLPEANTPVPNTLFVQDPKSKVQTLAQIKWRMGPHLGAAYIDDPILLAGAKKFGPDLSQIPSII